MSNSLQRPLKLALFTPLAPQPSGVSDYSQDLLPHLAVWADIHLFVADYHPTDAKVVSKFPVWNYREYPWRRQAHRYDCTIYQMGNSPVHRYMYSYLSTYSGVVVLHDFVLHHLLAGMAVDHRQSGLYFREMAYSYGVAGLAVARNVLLGPGEPPFFDYPLCQRTLDSSLGVLVHSQHLVEEVRALRPQARVGRVAMGIPLPPDPGPKPVLRERLGLPSRAFIVGSFGEATHHKRIPVVLQAFARLLSEGIDAYYVVAGNVAPSLDLERQAKSLGVEQKVRVTGFLPEQIFNQYLHAVDACVNLRYPTAGETSASALRSMAAGQPTLVSDVGANRELPSSGCFRLPVDAAEESLLTRVLHLLAADEELRGQLGYNAREYIRRYHSLEGAARDYIGFIEGLMEQSPSYPADFKPEAADFDRRYLSTLVQHLRELGFGRDALSLLPTVSEGLAAVGLDIRGRGAGPINEHAAGEGSE